MARTPLLRSLAQLAADHAAAAKRDVSLEVIRTERAELRAKRTREISRREFLAGAAAAGVALAASAAIPRPLRAADASRIAIVGGGIAGLSAALTLADRGIASTVYEAHPSRIGGRMHTDSPSFRGDTGYWADGQVSEWGGELIDTGHKTVQFLAQRFKLPLDDLLAAELNGAEDTYYFFGAYYPKRQADIDFKPVHQALQRDVQAASYPTTFDTNTPSGIELDYTSVYDWIETRIPGGHRSPLGQLLDVAYAIEFGAETTEQSSLNLVYLLGYNASPGNFSIFGASDERYHIRGGNQQLPERIKAHLESLHPGAVRHGWRLAAVARSGASYALSFDTTGGSTTITADHVVLALPFAVLRTLDYRRAGFDAWKDVAIQELGSGRNGKLQLQFTSRYWNQPGPWPGISNGAAYSDTGFQNTWDVSRAQPGASGILVDYTGGDVTTAIRASTAYSDAGTSTQVANAAKRFLDQIEPVYPGLTSRWDRRATLSLPHLDPNLNCSYSYWQVGQYTTIAGREGLRQGNVHFAGEHTSIDFQGWMEGGAITGVRAANEILDDLKFG